MQKVKPKGRVRPIQINFYVDEKEHEAIRTKMQKMGITNLSVYLRKMALEGKIIQVDFSCFDGIAESIHGVSRNINQIAKRVNATDNIYAEDIRQIRKQQESIWELLKTILYGIDGAVR